MEKEWEIDRPNSFPLSLPLPPSLSWNVERGLTKLSGLTRVVHISISLSLSLSLSLSIYLPLSLLSVHFFRPKSSSISSSFQLSFNSGFFQSLRGRQSATSCRSTAPVTVAHLCCCQPVKNQPTKLNLFNIVKLAASWGWSEEEEDEESEAKERQCVKKLA